MQNRFVIYTDGGARGNPGPAAIGFVIFQISHEGALVEMKRFGETIGVTTNNQAEYRAVIRAFEEVLLHHPSNVEFRLDSELVAKQLRGEYRVKDTFLKPLFARVKYLEHTIPQVLYTVVRRELNQQADGEVNRALDQAQ